MHKTLSTFALGLALTFGAAAFAPAASAAPSPAPTRVSVAEAKIATPKTKAQYVAAIKKLKADRAAAIKSFKAAHAAEEKVFDDREADYQKAIKAAEVKFAGIRDKGLAKVEAEFKAKYPALHKALAAAQASYDAKQVKLGRKMNELSAVAKSLDKAMREAKTDAEREKIRKAMESHSQVVSKESAVFDAASGKNYQDLNAKIAALTKNDAGAWALKKKKIVAIYAEDLAAWQKFHADNVPPNEKQTESLHKMNALSEADKKAGVKFTAELNKLKAGLKAAKA